VPGNPAGASSFRKIALPSHYWSSWLAIQEVIGREIDEVAGAGVPLDGGGAEDDAGVLYDDLMGVDEGAEEDGDAGVGFFDEVEEIEAEVLEAGVRADDEVADKR